jgi:hypothetical protein
MPETNSLNPDPVAWQLGGGVAVRVGDVYRMVSTAIEAGALGGYLAELPPSAVPLVRKGEAQAELERYRDDCRSVNQTMREALDNALAECDRLRAERDALLDQLDGMEAEADDWKRKHGDTVVERDRWKAECGKARDREIDLMGKLDALDPSWVEEDAGPVGTVESGLLRETDELVLNPDSPTDLRAVGGVLIRALGESATEGLYTVAEQLGAYLILRADRLERIEDEANEFAKKMSFWGALNETGRANLINALIEFRAAKVVAE